MENAYDNTRDVGDNSHDSEGTTATNLAPNTVLGPVTASNVTNSTATLEHANDNTRDIGDTFTAALHPQILMPKPMTIAPVAHAHTHLGQHMCVGTVNIRKATQESISGDRKQVIGQDKKKRRPKRCGSIKFKGDHSME